MSKRIDALLTRSPNVCGGRIRIERVRKPAACRSVASRSV